MLISRFYTDNQEEEEIKGNHIFKISILGNPSVGKSALTIRYVQTHFIENYNPTIEEEFEKEQIVSGHNVSIRVLDTAGQEDFLALRNRWIDGRDAFIIAIEASKADLSHVKK